MKMSCDRVQSLLPEALRGMLDEGTRAEALRHADHCPACAEARRFHSRLHAALTLEPMAAPPPLYFEGVLEEIHRAMPLAPPRRAPVRRRLLRPQSMATAMVATLALIWFGSGLMMALGDNITQPPFCSQTHGHLARLTPLSRAAQNRNAKPVTVVEGYGFVAADAEWLRMSPEQRRELGLPVEG